YERTKLMGGVIHVTAGIGGSTLEEDGTCLWLGGCPAPSWCAFRAMHHGVLRLRITPTAIHGEAICGPAGDSGSNQNDIQCSSGSIFDSFMIGTDLVDVPASGAEPARLALERVFPNPTSAPFSIQYTLANPAPASLDLVDIAGRSVAHQSLGAEGPGRHVVRFSPRKGLPPGTYWVRLTQAGQSAVSRIVLIR